MIKRYSSELKRLEKLGLSDGLYKVTFEDGTSRTMDGTEIVLYSMDCAAGCVDIGVKGYKPQIVSFEHIAGKYDLTQRMEEFIQNGIMESKERSLKNEL